MKVTLPTIREYLLYLFLFLLPLQTRWIFRDVRIYGGERANSFEQIWEYGRMSVYVFDVLLAVLVIISLPLVYKKIQHQISHTTYWKNPVVVFLLLLLLTLVSLAWTPDKWLVFYWSARLAEAGLLVLLFNIIKPNIKKVLFVLVCAGVLQAGWGVAQFATQSITANKWIGVAVHQVGTSGSVVTESSVGRILRSYAGQPHPNVLGGLLALTLFVTLVLLEKTNRNNIYARVSLFMVYAVEWFGLMLTFSRGAWLATVLGMGYWLYSSKLIKRDRFVVVATTTLVIGICLVFFYQPVFERLTGSGRLEQQSLDERSGYVQQSGSLLSNNLLLGVGVGNYTKALYGMIPGQATYAYQPVHNVYLLVVTELGIVGMLVFIWLLFISVRWLATNHQQFANYSLLFLLPIAVTALFDHYWWTLPSMQLIAVVVLIMNIDEKHSAV